MVHCKICNKDIENEKAIRHILTHKKHMKIPILMKNNNIDFDRNKYDMYLYQNKRDADLFIRRLKLEGYQHRKFDISRRSRFNFNKKYVAVLYPLNKKFN